MKPHLDYTSIQYIQYARIRVINRVYKPVIDAHYRKPIVPLVVPPIWVCNKQACLETGDELINNDAGITSHGIDKAPQPPENEAYLQLLRSRN